MDGNDSMFASTICCCFFFLFCAITNIPFGSCKDTEPALVYRYFLATRVGEKTWHRENGKVLFA